MRQQLYITFFSCCFNSPHSLYLIVCWHREKPALLCLSFSAIKVWRLVAGERPWTFETISVIPFSSHEFAYRIVCFALDIVAEKQHFLCGERATAYFCRVGIVACYLVTLAVEAAEQAGFARNCSWWRCSFTFLTVLPYLLISLYTPLRVPFWASPVPYRIQ